MKQVKMEKLLAKLENKEQVTIVTLGDSNTELTFHTRGRLNWPMLLQEALFEKYGPAKVIMINAAHCGSGVANGLERLERDVLRFNPDLVIIGYYDNDMESLREIIGCSRKAGVPEILLRTPNPIVAPNMPLVTLPVKGGYEWPDPKIGKTAESVKALGGELNIPVCDHYNAWLESDFEHKGMPVTNPNKLWMRMSDASHPNDLGHLAFYRELAPFFGLPVKLSWEH